LNAVEIEEAISQLADQPFDPDSFPYVFLEAFGNKETTIKRLKSGSSNASDIEGGVLQRNNIHIAVCAEGDATNTLALLKSSPATTKAKAKFILATDGLQLEAEDLNSGETVACEYPEVANHFGFFLPLAGITTVKQIRDNPIDIQATSRLNRLYVELLKTNEDWASDARAAFPRRASACPSREYARSLRRSVLCSDSRGEGAGTERRADHKSLGRTHTPAGAGLHSRLFSLLPSRETHRDALPDIPPRRTATSPRR
jgi:hypothetical protein